MGGNNCCIKRSKFQSTLPVAGERSLPGRRTGLRHQPVSIHAPRCRGAKPWHDGRHADRRQVSIHAPRCRGAKPNDPLPIPGHHPSFNPRSPLPGSEARDIQRMRICLYVSIHAPRCRGAKPVASNTRLPVGAVSIHAPRCRGAKPFTGNPRRLREKRLVLREPSGKEPCKSYRVLRALKK